MSQPDVDAAVIYREHLADQAAGLIEADKANREAFKQMSEEDRLDIAYAVRAQLLEMAEHPEVWMPEAVLREGDQIHVSFRLGWDSLLARTRDRARAIREARSDLETIDGALEQR